jgi:hypothetical protein
MDGYRSGNLLDETGWGVGDVGWVKRSGTHQLFERIEELRINSSIPKFIKGGFYG